MNYTKINKRWNSHHNLLHILSLFPYSQCMDVYTETIHLKWKKGKEYYLPTVAISGFNNNLQIESYGTWLIINCWQKSSQVFLQQIAFINIFRSIRVLRMKSRELSSHLVCNTHVTFPNISFLRLRKWSQKSFEAGQDFSLLHPMLFYEIRTVLSFWPGISFIGATFFSQDLSQLIYQAVSSSNYSSSSMITWTVF